MYIQGAGCGSYSVGILVRMVGFDIPTNSVIRHDVTERFSDVGLNKQDPIVYIMYISLFPVGYSIITLTD